MSPPTGIRLRSGVIEGSERELFPAGGEERGRDAVSMQEQVFCRLALLRT